MIQYLYNSNEDGWNLQKPNLILSVTGKKKVTGIILFKLHYQMCKPIFIVGGAKNFSIPQRIKKAFKSGFIRAAATTGAW